jgi:hypothetical protein
MLSQLINRFFNWLFPTPVRAEVTVRSNNNDDRNYKRLRSGGSRP